jgi:hypothetical protein
MIQNESEKLILHHQHAYGLIESNHQDLEECDKTSELDKNEEHKEESHGEEKNESNFIESLPTTEFLRSNDNIFSIRSRRES